MHVELKHLSIQQMMVQILYKVPNNSISYPMSDSDRMDFSSELEIDMLRNDGDETRENASIEYQCLDLNEQCDDEYKSPISFTCI